MHLISLLLLIIVFFNVTIGQKSSNKLSCSEDGLKKTDEKFSRMAIVASDRQFPTNDQELKKFCKENQEIDRYVKAYTKQCFSGITKTMVNALAFSISNTNKQICRNRKRGQQLISIGDCGNQNRAGIKKCVENVADSVTMIKTFNQSEYKLMIPYLCCNVQVVKQCFQKQLQSVGPPKCTEEKIDQLADLFDKYVLDVMNFACSDYDANDRCTGILKKFKNRPRPARNQNLPASPVIAGLEAVKFMENIDLSV